MNTIEKIDFKKGAEFLKKVGKAGIEYCKQNPEACKQLAEKAVGQGKTQKEQGKAERKGEQRRDYKQEIEKIAKMWNDLQNNPALLSLFTEVVLDTPNIALKEFAHRLRESPQEKAFLTFTKYIGISPYRKTTEPARVWQWKDEFSKVKGDGLKFLSFARELAQGKVEDAKRIFSEMSPKAQEELKKYLFPYINLTLDEKVEIQPVKPRPQARTNHLMLAVVGLIAVGVVVFVIWKSRKVR